MEKWDILHIKQVGPIPSSFSVLKIFEKEYHAKKIKPPMSSI